LNERGATQELQMPRGVREREARTGREVLDTPLALRKMFQQFEPVRMAERLCNRRKAGEYLLFWACR
jgi:hypothetical protein